MRVLVTGASGFVGRQAVSALLATGAEVHAVSRQPLPIDCAWHGVDLLDPDAAVGLVRQIRPDAVLHLAWCVGHGLFWTDPANTQWVAATLALARAAAKAGCRRFVGVGTGYEYDWPAASDCIEGVTPLAGHTPYDIAKAECRAALETLFAGQGVGFAWARLFFLYGPHEDPRRLVSSVARALVRGEPAPCSHGLAVRDFMDVRDAGAALAAITLSGVTGAINVGSGFGARIAEVASTLGDLAGRPDLIKLGALPDRADEPPRIVADVTRLTEEVGFRPRFDLQHGLKDALAFWKAEGPGATPA
jgi:nucleoside-diphosphate-sugar epimerase